MHTIQSIDPGEPADRRPAGDIDLIDTDAACAIVGGTRPIHRATLWRLVKRGVLPPPNRLKRWDRHEFVTAVRRYLEAG